MRILAVHNYYGDYAPGGEGNVLAAERALLEAHGHEVITHARTNAELAGRGWLGRLRGAWESAWSIRSYRQIQEVIRRTRPDVMHVHNYWMLLSPSIFRAAKELGVATVLTAHNYRLACPAGQFMRAGRPCEDCLGKHPWRVVARRCYRDAVIPSILSCRLFQTTRKRRVFQRDVDAVVALTEFARGKLIAAGIPESIVHVKPNFIPDPLDGELPSATGNGALFIGRLSPEKGLNTLLEAWREVDYPLTIAGDGPMRKRLESIAPAGVRFLGWIDPGKVLSLVRNASFAILPSTWYEGFPRTLVECFAMGRAVAASRLGSMAEIIEDGRNGLLFAPGDQADLQSKVRLLARRPDLAGRMGRQARNDYLDKYGPERNCEMLVNIFRRALARSTAA